MVKAKNDLEKEKRDVGTAKEIEKREDDKYEEIKKD
jgi:hypothetical protein